MTAPPPIYLDNAATTRPLEEVVERMGQAHLEWFGNPSSGHDYALAPHKALSDAREYLRGTLSAAEVDALNERFETAHPAQVIRWPDSTRTECGIHL